MVELALPKCGAISQDQGFSTLSKTKRLYWMLLLYLYSQHTFTHSFIITNKRSCPQLKCKATE